MNIYQIILECTNNTKNYLDLEFYIDGKSYFANRSNLNLIAFEFPYHPTDIVKHEFTIVINGKRKLIDDPDINDDQAAWIIQSFCFDKFKINEMLDIEYSHDYNGFGDLTVEKYKKESLFWFGHDGQAKFDFFTPLSFWVSKDYPY